MSESPQGPDWWQASDGKWYRPEQSPALPPPPAAVGPVGIPTASTKPVALADLQAQYEQAPTGASVQPSAVPASVPTVPLASATTAVPAGWYPDPNDKARQRYWDGAAWGPLAPAPTSPRSSEPATIQRQGRGIKIAAIVAGAVVVLVVISVLFAGSSPAPPAPLTLQAFNSTPQLAVAQGVSCTRQGSNAVASGTVQNLTAAPLTVYVLVATGTQSKETAQQTVTLNFSGGVLGTTNLPWQASVPANGAPTCFIAVKAVLDIP